MKRLALLALLAAACTAPAREVRREEPPAPVHEEVTPPREEPKPIAVPKPVVEEGYVIDYRAQAEGRTLLEVARPRDAQVEIYEGNKLLAKDTAPTSRRVDGDGWYRVHVRLPSGMEVDRKIQALPGLVTSLRFTDIAPQGPSAMPAEDFRKLLHALDLQEGDTAKLAVLKTAAASSYFTAEMAGKLIDHVVYRENKLEAVPILRGRILDRQNTYTIYQHFTYREDKAKVQEMLEQ